MIVLDYNDNTEGVELRLGVRINTGGCAGSLFITMHTVLDRF
jgi:hypothetical protein